MDLLNAFIDTARTFAPYLAGLSLAYLVYLGAERLLSASLRRQASRSLADYYQPIQAEQEHVQTGSFEHKVRLAALKYGVKAEGRENVYFYGAVALIGLLVLFAVQVFHLPFVLLPAGVLLGYVFVRSLIEGEWGKMRVAMEKELPAFLLRLSATLQASPNVIDAMQDVTETLDPRAPLRPWMQRVILAMQQSGQKGLEEMRDEAEAISSSLLIVIMTISRLWETGGAGYIHSFQVTARGLSNLLSARGEAQAKADGAWGTIRVILLALGGAIVMAMSNPASGYLFSSALGQAGLLILLGWGAVGWNVIQDAIREVTD